MTHSDHNQFGTHFEINAGRETINCYQMYCCENCIKIHELTFIWNSRSVSLWFIVVGIYN